MRVDHRLITVGGTGPAWRTTHDNEHQVGQVNYDEQVVNKFVSAFAESVNLSWSQQHVQGAKHNPVREGQLQEKWKQFLVSESVQELSHDDERAGKKQDLYRSRKTFSSVIFPVQVSLVVTKKQKEHFESNNDVYNNADWTLAFGRSFTLL